MKALQVEECNLLPYFLKGKMCESIERPLLTSCDGYLIDANRQ